MSTTTEPPTLGPADVSDQVPPKKTRKAKAKPKTDRMLNPLANELTMVKEVTIIEALQVCGHVEMGAEPSEEQRAAIERLVRADERFVVFIQDGVKRVGLASTNPAEAQLEQMAESVEVKTVTPTLSEQLEKQAAFEQQVQAEAKENPAEVDLFAKTDTATDSAPVDTQAPAAPADNIPTLGEMAAQVVADAAAAPVSETISKLPTAMERVQFELNCYMQRAAKVRALGQIYQQLKGQQAELQGQLTDIHKQLKDTAKKLADLAVERVDLTFQDPIPFAVAPEDTTTAEDAGLKDEHGEPVTTEEAAQEQQTIPLSDAPVDLTHLDNPGSGAEIPPAAAEQPATIPLDELAAAAPVDDLDSPPT